MIKRVVLFVLVLVCAANRMDAQVVDDDYQIEQQLLASTKQLNQFFKRFNGEENNRGDELEPGDRLYRSARLRKRYLGMLFDEERDEIPKSTKNKFIDFTTGSEQPKYLNLRS